MPTDTGHTDIKWDILIPSAGNKKKKKKQQEQEESSENLYQHDNLWTQAKNVVPLNSYNYCDLTDTQLLSIPHFIIILSDQNVWRLLVLNCPTFISTSASTSNHKPSWRCLQWSSSSPLGFAPSGGGERLSAEVGHQAYCR